MADKVLPENSFYVYEHWRPDTGLCFYVGKGRGYRSNRVERRNAYHKNIVAKLRSDGLELEVRIFKENLFESEAFIIEIERIAYWKNIGVRLANQTDGGEGASGYKHTAETREKLKQSPAKREAARIRMTGRPVSEDTKEKIRKQRIGTHLLEETKIKLSHAMKDRYFSPTHRERISAGLKGRIPSTETRNLWSSQRAGKKTKPCSPEKRAKISASLKGHSVSIEQIEKQKRTMQMRRDKS